MPELEASEFSAGLRAKLARLSLRPVAKGKDDGALFSPTHFSVDLFAPHATVDQVIGTTPETPGEDVAGLAGSREFSYSGLSPRSQAKHMLTMIDSLHKLNHPGCDELTEEEWSELGITWSVPIAGTDTDLQPGGSAVLVPLRDKDRYCSLARDALETCIRQADMYS
eukprot:TRINITY_DN7113_c0_g1_i1.p1 TRINITY_DN7113_c0_g1~~TRINITY_DN7113_c0_g1_i1.p1  ORF type:complete len:194 (+),score=54.68 TRINITY_DN7113_c0_g1_i1:84-584(+)